MRTQPSQVNKRPDIDYTLVLDLLNAYKSSPSPLPAGADRLHAVVSRLDPEQHPPKGDVRAAAKRWLDDGLDRYGQASAEEAEIIRKRFFENTSQKELAKLYNRNVDQMNRTQRGAIEGLARTLSAMESDEEERWRSEMLQKLGGQKYGTLFGRDALIEECIEILQTDDATDILVISGMGGIGKSTVADAVSRRTISGSQFQRIAYLYIPTGAMTEVDFIWEMAAAIDKRIDGNKPRADAVSEEIGRTLKAIPHLVFVDGVEEDIDRLVEIMANWAGPTKFLVTSRVASTWEGALKTIQIEELSRADARGLLQDTIDRIPQTIPVRLDELMLETIYEKVGGNPLGLKMVAGLTAEMTLQEIIDDLKTVENPDTVQLYKRVFLKLWYALSRKAQQVLVSLALSNQKGVTRSLLIAMNRARPQNGSQPTAEGLLTIPRGEMMEIIRELRLRSLLEIYGDDVSDQYRIGVHNLTRSFVKADFIELPPGFAAE